MQNIVLLALFSTIMFVSCNAGLLGGKVIYGQNPGLLGGYGSVGYGGLGYGGLGYGALGLGNVGYGGLLNGGLLDGGLLNGYGGLGYGSGLELGGIVSEQCVDCAVVGPSIITRPVIGTVGVVKPILTAKSILPVLPYKKA